MSCGGTAGIASGSAVVMRGGARPGVGWRLVMPPVAAFVTLHWITAGNMAETGEVG